MSRTIIMGLVALLLTGVSSAVHACPMWRPIDLNLVSEAELVVVGRITDYTSILGPTPAKPAIPHARFKVLIDEVILGQTAKKAIPVVWINSTFGEPQTLLPGPWLIALHDLNTFPRDRSIGEYVKPALEPGTMTILQAPCSSAFLFENASNEAAAVRNLLTRKR